MSVQPPSQWATGADPMTSKQAGFIKVLAKQAGESSEEAEQETQGLDKGAASEKIQELQGKAKGGSGGGVAGGAGDSAPPAPAEKGDEQAQVDSSADRSKQAGGAGGAGGGAQPDSDEYLQHPEGWATGGEPATEKQKSFLAVLAKQSGDPDAVRDIDGLSKSDASAKIDAMKS